MQVIVSSAAEREIRRLPGEMLERILAALRALRDNPRPHGCKLLHDQASRIWRIRVGDWRILYDVDDTAGVVTVLRVLHRSRAYS